MRTDASTRTPPVTVSDHRSPLAQFVALHPVASFLLVALPLSLGLMPVPVLA